MAWYEETIPVKAMSVNKAWRGRRFKSADYLSYERECLLQMEERETIDYPVRIEFIIHIKNPNQCDADNFIKPILDIIVKKGWIKDDRLVWFVSAEKKKARKERIVMRLAPYKKVANKI